MAKSFAKSLETDFVRWDRSVDPPPSPRLHVVDLFCGAGGLAEGFRMAGFKAVLGVDNWQPAAETFRHNHPTAEVIVGDIAELDETQLVKETTVAPGQIGVLCGGPPCQGFSVAGKRLADDPRNLLYRHFLRAVEILEPEWVVMENVPQLLRTEGVAEAIHEDFRSLQTASKARYEVQHRLVGSADYGVPQTRTRVLFVARRIDNKNDNNGFSLDEDLAPIFSSETDLFGSPGYVTVEEAIGDLPQIEAGQGADEMDYDAPASTGYEKLMRGKIQLQKWFAEKGLSIRGDWGKIKRATKVYNHQAQRHSPLLVERFDNIPPGGSKEDLRVKRPDLLPPEGHKEQGLTYGRLWTDRPAPTIPANYSRPSGNRSIHPTIPRLITPREALRLSSFPDAYRVSGGMVAQREQAGNAVPPLLAFHVARKIREHLGI